MANKKSGINVAVLIGIILIGAISRAPLTAVGTLVSNISADMGLSSAAAGMITTIPLLAFAFVSPFVTRIAKSYGYGRTLCCALIILAIGTAIRSLAGTPGVYIGTILMGIGIAFGNVLTPGIIKMKFPEQVGLATGVYVASLAVFSGIAAAVSVPVATLYSWKMALGMWVIVVAACLGWWMALSRGGLQEGSSDESANAERKHSRSVYTYKMAYILAAYFGLQSILYYCFVAWLPTILVFKGYSQSGAGFYTTLNQMVGLPMAFFVPIVAAKLRNQKSLALLVGVIYFIGMGILFACSSPVMMAVALGLCGLGAGASTSLVTVDITLRASHGEIASELAGMSQLIGYILAAIGPTLLGRIYDSSGSWTVPIILMLVAIVIMTVVAFIAGRDVSVGE